MIYNNKIHINILKNQIFIKIKIFNFLEITKFFIIIIIIIKNQQNFVSYYS
jgi:hypothetical protein